MIALRSVVFILLIALACSEKHSYILSKLDQVVYVYPNNTKTDKELRACQPNSVCGAVNQRYWLPPFAYRFCNCPKSQCPFAWSEDDDQSIPLDNRSQLKTCEDTRNLPICGKAVGLTVTTDLKSEYHEKDIRVFCNCQWPAYWRLNSREANSTVTISKYSCTQLGKCKSGQFCGHTRSDTYSTYYQCSCPRDHLCINVDNVMRNVTELLYFGQMLRAHCVPKYANNV